jgi:SAM-dependent methyltransferase
MFRALLNGFAAAFAAAALIAVPAFAQQKGFEPQIGQAGKDVIWVPTPDEVVERMLRMAQTTPQDYVIDLGAGDGKIAIAAAKKFGAKALGIEYNPDMVVHAQRNAERAGVLGKAQIIQGDIFTTDFSQATVLTLYLLPNLNLKLRSTILTMRPGTRVVSHSFNMENWDPDEVSDIDNRRIYFWVVPANVQGGWSMDVGGEKIELSLLQTYQKIDGSVRLGSVEAGLREPRLRGADIRFGYVDNNGMRREFTGRVTGGRMEGLSRVDGGQETRWTASRK